MNSARQNAALKLLAQRDTQRFANTSTLTADLVINVALSMSPQRNRKAPLNLKAKSKSLPNADNSCQAKSTVFKKIYLP